VREHAQRGYPSTTIRLTNVYVERKKGRLADPRITHRVRYGGWEDRLARIVPTFVCRALSNATIHVFGRKQVINFLHIDDATDALVRAGALCPARQMCGSLRWLLTFCWVPSHQLMCLSMHRLCRRDVRNICLSSMSARIRR